MVNFDYEIGLLVQSMKERNLDKNYDQESHVIRLLVGNRGGMVICFEEEILEFVL